MGKKRTLQELTIKDNFMFTAVMMDEANCLGFLERVLGREIDHVVVDREKSLIYHPDYHGVRLDVYAKGNSRAFNIEMQIQPKNNLPKRSRYYHDQIDMSELQPSEGYEMLPEAYVIFVCDFDPFGDGKYRYTFEEICQETDRPLQNGRHTIFLNTKGTNDAEVPQELINLLQFIGAAGTGSKEDFKDRYVRQLQESVDDTKKSRQMEERFMMVEELLQEEFQAGKAEGQIATLKQNILDILKEKGIQEADVKDLIEKTKDSDTLQEMLLLSVRCEGAEDFLRYAKTEIKREKSKVKNA